jgi:hypothetical protein
VCVWEREKLYNFFSFLFILRRKLYDGDVKCVIEMRSERVLNFNFLNHAK